MSHHDTVVSGNEPGDEHYLRAADAVNDEMNALKQAIDRSHRPDGRQLTYTIDGPSLPTVTIKKAEAGKASNWEAALVAAGFSLKSITFTPTKTADADLRRPPGARQLHYSDDAMLGELTFVLYPQGYGVRVQDTGRL